MAEKSVRVVLSAAVGGFKSAMSDAAKSVDRVGASAAKLSREAGWGHIEKAAVGASIAVVGAVGAMVSTYARFDEAISQVGAATGASVEDLGLLRQAAMDAGAEFGQFSSIDAAGAIEELGKAGLDTSQIVGGALRGAMALAASDGMAVADAAELTADALAMFSLKGSDATRVADLLAQGAGAATGSARDLGMALSQVGAVAASTGLTIDDTTTALALFAKNGIKGSDAGTSLKTMLMALANPSKKARALMDELQISAFNASGEFIGMRDFSQQLSDRLSGLSTEQRNAALATIFGSDAMRVAAIATKEGAAGYDAMAKAMGDFGSAAEMAAKRTDNLKGDLAELGGAWENLMIAMGENADGPLRKLVQSLTDLIAFAQRHQALTTAIAGTVGALVALGATSVGLVRAAKALAEVRAAIVAMDIAGNLKASVAGLKELHTQAGKAAIALGAVAAAVGILAALPDAAVVSTDKYTRSLEGVAKGANGASTELDKLVASGIDNWGYAASDQIHSLSDAFEGLENTGWLAQHVGNLGKAMGDFLGMDIDTRWTSLLENIGNLDKALSGMDIEKQADAFAHVAESAADAGVSADKLAEAMPATFEALRKAASEAGVFNLSNQQIADWMGGKIPPALAKTEGAVKTMGQALSETTESQEASVKAAEEQYSAYMKAANGALQLSGSQMGLEAAIDDATASLKENGETLDTGTEKGRANQTALDNIAGATLKLLESQRAMGKTTEELTATTNKGRTAFINAATQMGMTEAAANALADQYGLIPDDVATNVTAPGAANSKAEVDALQKVLDALPPTEQTIVKTIYETQGYEAAMQAWRNIQALNDKTIYVNVRQTAVKGVMGPQADGSVLDFYARGGIRERHVAQIAPAGAWRVWAEPETGGEAYIPLSPAKRGRSMDILEEVARRFGVHVRPFATGGLNAPDYRHSPSFAAAVPSGPMQIVGTLDLGDGLTGRIEGVLADVAADNNRRGAYR